MKNNANSAATTAYGAISTEDAPQLSRGLSLRHIMFIALGSAIGTGLFTAPPPLFNWRAPLYYSPM